MLDLHQQREHRTAFHAAPQAYLLPSNLRFLNVLHCFFIAKDEYVLTFCFYKGDSYVLIFTCGSGAVSKIIHNCLRKIAQYPQQPQNTVLY